MHENAKSLVESGSRLFSDKLIIDSQCQEIANHFYPTRATFTGATEVHGEYASHLDTGYPILVHRDLGNAIGSMLRPVHKAWFHIDNRDIFSTDERTQKHEHIAWMQWARDTQRRAMYDSITQLQGMTKLADMDFAAFGWAILQVTINRRDAALNYQNWHPKDVVWRQDAYRMISEIHRNWEPTAMQLLHTFGEDKLHRDVVRMARSSKSDERHRVVKCRHVIIRADEWHGGTKAKHNHPWTSITIDVGNEHVMEEIGSPTRQYVIPRWMPAPNSQYAFSPATVVGLPDARTLQAMLGTLLTAGERAVDPPMIGHGAAFREDLDVTAGAFTTVNPKFTGTLDEALRPLNVDKHGIPYGIEMSDRVTEMLREAFFLNNLELPPHGGPDMTAFEVGQRVQEYIRRALPLFEPLESEYNGALCETTFELMMLEGAFGPANTIPEGLSGDLSFRFESPLHDGIERQKGQQFLESQQMIAAAAEADPNSLMIMNFPTALRSVLNGIGTPAEWMHSEQEVEQAAAARAQQEQQMMAMQQAQAGADVAKTFGEAAGQFAQSEPAAAVL